MPKTYCVSEHFTENNLIEKDVKLWAELMMKMKFRYLDIYVLTTHSLYIYIHTLK